jgi:hypothetical protein
MNDPRMGTDSAQWACRDAPTLGPRLAPPDVRPLSSRSPPATATYATDCRRRRRRRPRRRRPSLVAAGYYEVYHEATARLLRGHHEVYYGATILSYLDSTAR